jgi:CDP-diacylglycerol--serine O-phosphatidyltransferase
MKRFVGFYNYTVILTFASLVVSIIGMAQCLHGNYKAAILCLMASAALCFR